MCITFTPVLVTFKSLVKTHYKGNFKWPILLFTAATSRGGVGVAFPSALNLMNAMSPQTPGEVGPIVDSLGGSRSNLEHSNAGSRSNLERSNAGSRSTICNLERSNGNSTADGCVSWCCCRHTILELTSSGQKIG